MKIIQRRFLFGVALVGAVAVACSAAMAAKLDANERVYQHPKDKVYSAVVSTFNRLQIPLGLDSNESMGIVAGSSVTGASVFMKITNVTAQVVAVDDGTRVTYTRSKASAVKLARKPDNDPKPMVEFFDVLASELER